VELESFGLSEARLQICLGTNSFTDPHSTHSLPDWSLVFKSSLVQVRDEHPPIFSAREAAFHLDAKAGLPRKSHPDGAESLPWQTIALASSSASRECGLMTFRGFLFGSAAEVLDDDAG
jgi:hypothetical protein